MSDVVLINSNRMKPAVAPIGLDYLAGALSARGLDVDIIDLCFAESPLDTISEYFSRQQPVAIGISLRNTDDTYMASQAFFLPWLRDIVSRIREYCTAPIILGGAGFSIMPEAVLAYLGLDFGIWGEGESAFPLLVELLKNGESIFGVPGLVYRTENGFKRNAADFLSLNDLSVQRGAFQLARYFAEGGQGNIETKRGCNQGCTYCADPLSKGRQVRLRSPKSVADEVEQLLEFGVDCLHFCDSEFNLPLSHATAVCQEMVERGIGGKCRWYTYASPVPFTDEVATLMRRAGCVGVNFGVDSGNDGILRTLGRSFTAENLRQNAAVCHRQGLVFMYDLLLGGPGETFGTIQETLDLMKELSPDRVGVTLGLRVVPGTKFALTIKQDGPFVQNPNLIGMLEGNEEMLAPLFYLSTAVGESGFSFISRAIKGDERFLFAWEEERDRNYNYNDNNILVEAIKAGCRGAYWDILRMVAAEKRGSRKGQPGT